MFSVVNSAGFGLNDGRGPNGVFLKVVVDLDLSSGGVEGEFVPGGALSARLDAGHGGRGEASVSSAQKLVSPSPSRRGFSL